MALCVSVYILCFGVLSSVLGRRDGIPPANKLKTQNFQPISFSPLGGFCSILSAIIYNTG